MTPANWARQEHDLIGIGVGPSNLGLAALLDKVPATRALFLERKPDFSWHKDATLPNAMLQTTYLKDLVTMVDPTNRFSFLNYLASCRLMYAFVNRRISGIHRKEFDLYFDWVARSLANIRFASEVKAIRFDGERFIVSTDTDTYSAQNIVLGSGVEPNLLRGVTPSETVFHSSSYAARAKAQFAGLRVIVVGGGQSGAEVIDDLCSGDELPSEITWITNRQNLFPLQDCSFSNEAYTPNYNRYFYGLPGDVRR